MNRYSKNYLAEIEQARVSLDIDFLIGKTIALSGATGTIGSYLIDCLLFDASFDVKVIALVRDIPKAKQRFAFHHNDKRLTFILVDLMKPITIESQIDYVIHAASNTSPHEYKQHPIDTLLVNLLGNKTMCDLAIAHNSRYMFISSTEVYGQSDGSLIDESYLGYLNLLDPRSAYNEGKRASETLAIAYSDELGLDVVIPRLSRVYGPTQRSSDRKAMSQFINAGLHHEPIILKSAGNQMFSYTYVSDIISGLLFLLTHGQTGQAYNIASDEQKSLKEIATIIGEISGSEVKMDLSNDANVSYSKAEHALFDTKKIKALGWKSLVSLRSGLTRTFSVLS